MDLIRAILLEVERNEDPMRPLEVVVADYSPDEVSYHVKLLNEAGFVEAIDKSHLRGMVWRPKSLTWKGHEFLDAIRNERVMHKVKAELKEKAISLPFAIVQQLAINIAASLVGL